MKTQKEIRKLFWIEYPKADRRKVVSYDGAGRMYKTDIRVMFVEFIDCLEKSGQITKALASRVTL